MNPFFLFCLVGFAAAADVTVGHVGVYIGGTCSVKDSKGASGYKNGNVFVEVGGCTKMNDGTKSQIANCANDTAMGFVEYNTTNCKGPVAKSEVVSLSSVCKGMGGVSMRLDGKCGAVMNCVTNATETPMKKHVCTAKAVVTTTTKSNNSSKKTSDATAASATVGLVISALALRL